MPVIEDNIACYNMDHEYRGIAVIISNDIFEGAAQSLPMRNCSVKDVIDLQTILLHMDFEVLIWNNLYHDELTYRISKLAEKDHSKNDCLVVVVMTYGINSSFIYARESPYKVEYLWNKFTSDKCPTLAGKPKMFFIQVYYGEQLDYDVILKSETNFKVCSSNTVYTNPKKVPKYADFLIVISAYDDYFSLNHPNHGSWFIQSLCLELIINDLATIDILRIMTRVSLRVILDYESSNPELSMLHKQKQIPSIKSTLIRDVYFRSKIKPLPKPAVFEVCLVLVYVFYT